MTNIIRIVTFSIGMITTTTGGYNIQPWTSLQLDAIPTMMDYNTVIIGPGTFNYSVSYGYEATSIPAICELGKNVVTILRSMKLLCEKYLFAIFNLDFR